MFSVAKCLSEGRTYIYLANKLLTFERSRQLYRDVRSISMLLFNSSLYDIPHNKKSPDVHSDISCGVANCVSERRVGCTGSTTVSPSRLIDAGKDTIYP